VNRVDAAQRTGDPDGGRASAVRTEGLAKTYDDGFTAVRGLDLEVPAGQIFGLLGPNGAGKTTTIGMLTTRVVPTSGRAWVGGVDVVGRPARAKRQIGVVPQTNTLDRSLTVRENLYFHGRYFGMGRHQSAARADALLDRFRLAEKADRRTETLSGGMAQRLMVARALLHGPEVLFLDEPTTGLDPQSRIALWAMLGELHAEGQSILITTHYMDEADRLCDRLAIMDHGRVLAAGTPAELKAQVDADAMVEIVADGELAGLSSRLAEVEGVSRTDVRDGAVRVFAEVATPLLPALLARAHADGVVVRDVRVSEPTLESVFIALTGRELRD
jgi:ABC-2 type transport system ATP-binding protein